MTELPVVKFSQERYMNEHNEATVNEEDEGRPLNFRQKEQSEQAVDPAGFTGFADQFLDKNFAKRWAALLWATMRSTGKGYRLYSQKHAGHATDRRGDKMDAAFQLTPTAFRRYKDRYDSPAARTR